VEFEPLPEQRVRQLREALLAGPQEFNPAWVADQGKVVVPFETPLALNDAFARRIVAAFGIGGHSIAWGFSAESWEQTLPYEGVIVPLDASAVASWHSSFLPFDMVLAAPDLSRAALFGQDEFGLVAGQPHVVETFLGTSISDARKAFAAYAEDMDGAARHLIEVARRYGCI
jgi:hypothetical protein